MTPAPVPVPHAVLLAGFDYRSNLGPDGRYYSSVSCRGAFCGVHTDGRPDNDLWQQMNITVLETLAEHEGGRTCWNCSSDPAEIVMLRKSHTGFDEKVAVCPRCYPEVRHA